MMSEPLPSVGQAIVLISHLWLSLSLSFSLYIDTTMCIYLSLALSNLLSSAEDLGVGSRPVARPLRLFLLLILPSSSHSLLLLRPLHLHLRFLTHRKNWPLAHSLHCVYVYRMIHNDEDKSLGAEKEKAAFFGSQKHFVVELLNKVQDFCEKRKQLVKILTIPRSNDYCVFCVTLYRQLERNL